MLNLNFEEVSYKYMEGEPFNNVTSVKFSFVASGIVRFNMLSS